MRMYRCPRCKTLSIPFKDKHKTGMWGNIYCGHCKAKLCAYPWLLALIWVFYIWGAVWFSGLFYFTHDSLDFVYMIGMLLIIDALSVAYLPLAVLRQGS
jgi:hypothetical protein